MVAVNGLAASLFSSPTFESTPTIRKTEETLGGANGVLKTERIGTKHPVPLQIR
jgi:hypothetical protein